MNEDWRAGMETLPRFVPEMRLEAPKTALLLIDIQHYSTLPEYGVGPHLKRDFPECFEYYYGRIEKLVLPNCRRLLDFFRGGGLRVIYLTIGSAVPDASDLRPLRARAASAKCNFWVGSPEYRIRDEIRPREGEPVILKTSASAFMSSTIGQTLRHMGVECLAVAGVVTYGCVLMTALDAADTGFKTFIVEDATAGYDRQHDNAALRIFAAGSGRVLSTEQAFSELKKHVK